MREVALLILVLGALLVIRYVGRRMVLAALRSRRVGVTAAAVLMAAVSWVPFAMIVLVAWGLTPVSLALIGLLAGVSTVMSVMFRPFLGELRSPPGDER
jgi:hypothetical protein